MLDEKLYLSFQISAFYCDDQNHINYVGFDIGVFCLAFVINGFIDIVFCALRQPVQSSQHTERVFILLYGFELY